MLTKEKTMAYNKILAERLRKILDDLNPPELEEKKMFGGVGYLVRGNMACGVNKDSLIVRTGEESFLEALSKPGARPFDLTRKPMKGWVMVALGDVESDKALKEWVVLGVDFAQSLQPK